jgi:hypothetical protein
MMSEQKSWVVTLSPGSAPETVRRDLEGAGFEIEQVMDAIGVVTGRSDDACAEKVRSLPGVADVSADQPIDIGPPGSPDTW